MAAVRYLPLARQPVDCRGGFRQARSVAQHDLENAQIVEVHDAGEVAAHSLGQAAGDPFGEDVQTPCQAPPAVSTGEQTGTRGTLGGNGHLELVYAMSWWFDLRMLALSLVRCGDRVPPARLVFQK